MQLYSLPYVPLGLLDGASVGEATRERRTMGEVTLILRLFFDYNFEAIEFQGFLVLQIRPLLIYERLDFYQVKNQAISPPALCIEKRNPGSVLPARLWRALSPGRPSSTTGAEGLHCSIQCGTSVQPLLRANLTWIQIYLKAMKESDFSLQDDKCRCPHSQRRVRLHPLSQI